jgi:hypothetical protein
LEKYFQQLLLSNVNSIHHNLQDALQAGDEMQTEALTLNKIKETIKMQKYQKARGKDGIPAELLEQ